MRPTSVEKLKKYLQPGMRLRKIPAHGEPEEFEVERLSGTACIFDATDRRPHGFAMLWPTSADCRFDAAGFDKLNSQGEVIVRYEWLDPDEAAPTQTA